MLVVEILVEKCFSKEEEMYEQRSLLNFDFQILYIKLNKLFIFIIHVFRHIFNASYKYILFMIFMEILFTNLFMIFIKSNSAHEEGLNIYFSYNLTFFFYFLSLQNYYFLFLILVNYHFLFLILKVF